MRFVTSIAVVVAIGFVLRIAAAQDAKPAPKADEVNPEMLAKIKAAAPDKAPATPAKARKLLVYTACGQGGFVHDSIPVGAAALKVLGEKTGAFTVTVSRDPAVFKPESLKEFDAVCFDNTTGELFTDAALKQSLLEFVKGGKGVIGIHAATDCFYGKWPEFGEIIGGYFDGHPWGSDQTVTIKVDDPASPLTAAFKGQPFQITDEIYQFKEPYSRAKLHELLSIDTTKTDMKRDGIKRKDGDFAISWIHEYGKGHVFYCSLGHNQAVFATPAVLAHYLAGIQYAMGDLKADATPSAKE